MQVSDVMTGDVTAVSPESSVREAARKMDQLNVGALPVCDGKHLVGVLTDRDIVVRSTAVGALPDATRVDEVMSHDVRWCFEHDAWNRSNARWRRCRSGGCRWWTEKKTWSAA